MNDWDRWDDDEPGPRGSRSPVATDRQEALPDSQYPDSTAWVTRWLAPTLRRHVNEKRAGETLAWCPQWALHPEAVDRLEGMWRAWEAAQVSTDPAAIAGWWLKIADPMLKTLMDANRGPFCDCYRTGHTDTLPPLPVTPPESASP